MSCLESLLFLWRRRVYGGSCKTSPFRRFPSRLSCCFAWQAWHFVTFRPVGSRVENVNIGGSLARNVHPRVSSRVSGFPVASPCLWGKLQNLSFSKVSKKVVMSFCVAGVARCDIPTCLITCRKCQNWRKSRTKCSFFCTHVSRLESLVFLRRRHVYGGSCKTSPFRMFPSRSSCRFVWQGWHFVTVQAVSERVERLNALENISAVLSCKRPPSIHSSCHKQLHISHAPDCC